MRRPLTYTSTGPGQAKGPSPSRFTVAPAGEGFEVVDFDGRPVERRASYPDAQAAADALNEAASGGGLAVAARIESL